MSRIDVWEARSTQPAQKIDCGYARNYHEKYLPGPPLGRGGFGVVKVVTDKETGKEYACKSITKFLEGNNSEKKQARHIGNIQREVAVLRKLRGTLNVAHLKQAYEDDRDVHVVLEYCRGGELWHRIGSKHYAERTVASFMRAVLRTLSQCHAHRILHRDIKPGNFMLLNDLDRAPLKAIDFGLAVFYEPGTLPRTDLGLEGTPWFMAPEVMSSEVYPSSDMWAAGVMAYQLLSGTLPFDDRRKPHSPALSVVWQAILTQEPSFSGKAWQDISEPAKTFVKRLLNKKHDARPTAKEALQEPWLQGNSLERTQGKPLDATVVQRLQRYSQTNVLKRTIFELIAEEILKRMTQQHIDASPDPSAHGNSHSLPHEAFSLSPAASMPQGGMPDPSPPSLSWTPFMSRRKRSLNHQELLDSSNVSVPIPRKVGMSAHGGLEYHRAMLGNSMPETSSHGSLSMSVHDANNWQMIKAAVEAAKQRRSGSLHGGQHFARSQEQHRKAARIALDTSAHAGSEYHNFMRLTSAKDGQTDLPAFQQKVSDRRTASSGSSVADRARKAEAVLAGALQPVKTRTQDAAEGSRHRVLRTDGFGESGKRGQSEYAQFLRRTSLDMTGSPSATAGASPDASPKQRRHSLATAGDAFATGADRLARDSLDWQSVASDADNAGQPGSADRQASGSMHLMHSETSLIGSEGPGPVTQQQDTDHRLSGSSDQPSTGEDTGDAKQQGFGGTQLPVEPANQSQGGDIDGMAYDTSNPQLLQHQQAQAPLGKEEEQTRQQQAGVDQVQSEAAQQEESQQMAEQRRLTFQEILRQQLQAHSHQVSPEEGSTPEPSQHPSHPSPAPSPPPPHLAHVSFEDMLRQQLGQQVRRPAASDPSNSTASQHSSGRTSPFQTSMPQARPTAFQNMLKQQLSQGSALAQHLPLSGTMPATSNGQGIRDDDPPVAAANLQTAGSGSRHGSDATHSSEAPHGMAQIIATGLRLTDAQGASSLVPLDELKEVMKKLAFSKEEKGIGVEQLAEGLRGLGYELAPSEMGVLMHQLAATQQGHVGKPAFLASQLDWQNFQQNFKDQWLDCARAAFAAVDSAEKGHISSGQLVDLISSKLPAEEVEHAVEDALLEAGCGETADLDFDAFLKLMRVNSLDSLDSLDQYDSRLNSAHNLQGLDSGGHGNLEGYGSQLEVVPE